MPSNGYVIHVGHFAPQKVIIAHPDPKTGQPGPDKVEVFKTNGVHQIINMATVWARRVLPDGKMPKDNGTEIPLEVHDVKYKGKLEFLPWQDSSTGAQAITIRYLKNSMSLDYDYQKNIQKIETKPDGSDGSAFINLAPGENKFDFNKEALFIQYLQVIPGNRDSVSKNPDPQIKGSHYYEKNDEVGKHTVAKREASLDAGIFVKGLSTKPGQLKNLLEVLVGYGVNFGEVNHLSGDNDIYTALLDFAGLYPNELKSYTDRFCLEEIIDRFSFAESFNALDVTKDGFIAFRNQKGESTILWKDIPAKGNKMKDWVVDHFAEEEVFLQIRTLKALCEKLK